MAPFSPNRSISVLLFLSVLVSFLHAASPSVSLALTVKPLSDLQSDTLDVVASDGGQAVDISGLFSELHLLVQINGRGTIWHGVYSGVLASSGPLELSKFTDSLSDKTVVAYALFGGGALSAKTEPGQTIETKLAWDLRGDEAGNSRLGPGLHPEFYSLKSPNSNFAFNVPTTLHLQVCGKLRTSAGYVCSDFVPFSVSRLVTRTPLKPAGRVDGFYRSFLVAKSKTGRIDTSGSSSGVFTFDLLPVEGGSIYPDISFDYQASLITAPLPDAQQVKSITVKLLDPAGSFKCSPESETVHKSFPLAGRVAETSFIGTVCRFPSGFRVVSMDYGYPSSGDPKPKNPSPTPAPGDHSLRSSSDALGFVVQSPDCKPAQSKLSCAGTLHALKLSDRIQLTVTSNSEKKPQVSVLHGGSCYTIGTPTPIGPNAGHAWTLDLAFDQLAAKSQCLKASKNPDNGLFSAPEPLEIRLGSPDDPQHPLALTYGPDYSPDFDDLAFFAVPAAGRVPLRGQQGLNLGAKLYIFQNIPIDLLVKAKSDDGSVGLKIGYSPLFEMLFRKLPSRIALSIGPKSEPYVWPLGALVFSHSNDALALPFEPWAQPARSDDEYCTGPGYCTPAQAARAVSGDASLYGWAQEAADAFQRGAHVRQIQVPIALAGKNGGIMLYTFTPGQRGIPTPVSVEPLQYLVKTGNQYEFGTVSDVPACRNSKSFAKPDSYTLFTLPTRTFKFVQQDVKTGNGLNVPVDVQKSFNLYLNFNPKVTKDIYKTNPPVLVKLRFETASTKLASGVLAKVEAVPGAGKNSDSLIFTFKRASGGRSDSSASTGAGSKAVSNAKPAPGTPSDEEVADSNFAFQMFRYLVDPGSDGHEINSALNGPYQVRLQDGCNPDVLLAVALQAPKKGLAAASVPFAIQTPSVSSPSKTIAPSPAGVGAEVPRKRPARKAGTVGTPVSAAREY